MSYSFDTIINRKNTNSIKYDFAVKRGKPENTLPLWVADMDFQAPKEVLDALIAKSQHGIFGYSASGPGYFPAIYSWYSEQFSWEPKEEWLIQTPGVVFAIACAIRSLTEPGDSVMIQQPVYYPFNDVIESNDRQLIVNSLKYENGAYSIDFEDFENKIFTHNVKLFLLCSPHNPVGRVWTESELRKLTSICLKYKVVIISDEIHSDFTWGSHKHTILASLSETIADNCIVCTSPSKTFNLAGLQVSNIWIKNQKLRYAFRQELRKTGYSQLNSMGLIACEAAYTFGKEWLSELKDYIQGNIDYVRDFLQNQLPAIHLVEPEGTYLLWLDFSKLNLSESELEDRITNKAGLWLDGGTMFGKEGLNFQRINVACPRSIIKQALEQLADAFSYE